MAESPAQVDSVPISEFISDPDTLFARLVREPELVIRLEDEVPLILISETKYRDLLDRSPPSSPEPEPFYVELVRQMQRGELDWAALQTASNVKTQGYLLTLEEYRRLVGTPGLIYWGEFTAKITPICRELEEGGFGYIILALGRRDIRGVLVSISHFQARKPEFPWEWRHSVSVAELAWHKGEPAERLQELGLLRIQRHGRPIGIILTPERFEEIFDTKVSREGATSPLSVTTTIEGTDLERILREIRPYFFSDQGELLASEVDEYYHRVGEVFPELVAEIESIAAAYESSLQATRAVAAYLSSVFAAIFEPLQRVPQSALAEDPIVKHEALRVSAGDRRVWYEGQELSIAGAAFDLLMTLMSDPTRVFLYPDLLRVVHAMGSRGNLRPYVTQLRQLLVEAGAPEGVYIINHHDRGYSLVRPSS